MAGSFRKNNVSRTGLDLMVSYGSLPRELVAEHLHKHLIAHASAEAINFAGPFVQRQLSINTPVGATGKARQSVTFEPAVPHAFGEVTGFVGYGAPASLYIGFANDGTRAHFPPITPLTYWAARKLGDASLGYALARHIAKYGTAAQKFVERTREEVQPTVSSMLEASITAYFNRL
jgi:hypothetical protein